MRIVQRGKVEGKESEMKEKRERTKSSNTVAARMKQVVDNMIVAKRNNSPHPEMTVFLYKSEQSEIMASFFQEMRRENMVLFENKSMLMNLIAARYDDMRAKQGQEGS